MKIFAFVVVEKVHHVDLYFFLALHLLGVERFISMLVCFVRGSFCHHFMVGTYIDLHAAHLGKRCLCPEGDNVKHNGAAQSISYIRKQSRIRSIRY